MSKKLVGKVAVVTGASKGIGASIARALAEEGASVVVNYSSSKQDAERVVAEITARGGKAIFVQADVSKPAHIERLFSEARRSFGRLDILVNNAGMYEFSPLEGVTEEHFHKHFNVNVLGFEVHDRGDAAGVGWPEVENRAAAAPTSPLRLRAPYSCLSTTSPGSFRAFEISHRTRCVTRSPRGASLPETGRTSRMASSRVAAWATPGGWAVGSRAAASAAPGACRTHAGRPR